MHFARVPSYLTEFPASVGKISHRGTLSLPCAGWTESKRGRCHFRRAPDRCVMIFGKRAQPLIRIIKNTAHRHP